MRAVLRAASSWGRGGASPRLPELEVLASGAHPAPDPTRPEAIAAGAWRRMGRAARLAAVPAAAVLGAAAEDRTSLALFWGTMTGEYGATRAFLDSLARKGPAGASPLHFQHSVHNAPAGLLSMALGLTGPSETICAGQDTGLALLERALAWVGLTGRPALVVAADELGPEAAAGLEFAPGPPYGEGSAALLLTTHGDGRPLVLDEGPADWTRAHAWPGEPTPAPGGRSHDERLGLFGCVDLVAIAALAAEGGSVGGQRAGRPWAARLG